MLFIENLYNEGVVLADFFSATCATCKMLAFVLKDVEKILKVLLLIIVAMDFYNILKYTILYFILNEIYILYYI